MDVEGGRAAGPDDDGGTEESERSEQPERVTALLALPGFFTLTVGSLGMRGPTSLAGGHPVRGFHDLLSMVTTVVALSVGLLLGSVLARRPQPLP